MCCVPPGPIAALPVPQRNEDHLVGARSGWRPRASRGWSARRVLAFGQRRALGGHQERSARRQDGVEARAPVCTRELDRVLREGGDVERQVDLQRAARGASARDQVAAAGYAADGEVAAAGAYRVELAQDGLTRRCLHGGWKRCLAARGVDHVPAEEQHAAGD